MKEVEKKMERSFGLVYLLHTDVSEINPFFYSKKRRWGIVDK